MLLRNSSGKVSKFLQYAQPDEKGWTEVVTIEELNAHFGTTEFSTINGGDWCRSDTPQLAKYNVERIKGSATNAQGKTVRKIIAVQLKGFKESAANRGIRKDIKAVIQAQKCAILCTSSDIQVDHKCPRLNLTPKVMALDTQDISDFQALCRAANAAKRGHCQSCIDSKTRFDARILGYTVSQWTGGSRFANNCVGCYWYDPVEFNHQVSKNYEEGRHATAPEEGALLFQP